jgi:hypothetical protein
VPKVQPSTSVAPPASRPTDIGEAIAAHVASPIGDFFADAASVRQRVAQARAGRGVQFGGTSVVPVEARSAADSKYTPGPPAVAAAFAPRAASHAGSPLDLKDLSSAISQTQLKRAHTQAFGDTPPIARTAASNTSAVPPIPASNLQQLPPGVQAYLAQATASGRVNPYNTPLSSIIPSYSQHRQAFKQWQNVPDHGRSAGAGRAAMDDERAHSDPEADDDDASDDASVDSHAAGDPDADLALAERSAVAAEALAEGVGLLVELYAHAHPAAFVAMRARRAAASAARMASGGGADAPPPAPAGSPASPISTATSNPLLNKPASSAKSTPMDTSDAPMSPLVPAQQPMN